MEGNLKQQCLDQSGLYVWLRKHVTMDTKSGMLHVTDLDGSETSFSISLLAVSTAKEWAFASALSGYGFDLECSSGKLLTFLVDDENVEICHQWTSAINEAIKALVEQSDSVGEAGKENTNNAPPPSSSSSSSSVDGIAASKIKMPLDIGSSADFQDFYAKNVMDTNTPVPKWSSASPREYQNALGNSNSSAPHHQPLGSGISSNMTANNNNNNNNNPTQSYNNRGYNSMPEFNSTQVLHRATRTGSSSCNNNLYKSTDSLPPPPPPLLSASMPAPYPTPAVPSELNPNRASEAILDLNERCRSLEEQLVNAQQEVNSGKVHAQRMKEELEKKNGAFLQLENEAWEKEKKAVAEVRDETEFRILRAVNENKSFYEASSKAAAAQHEAELECLREELAAERKRHSTVTEREAAWRSKLEHDESESRAQVSALSDKLHNVQMSHRTEKNELESQLASVQRELNRVQVECDRKVETLQAELQAVNATSKKEFQERVAELNVKFEKSLAHIRELDSKAIRDEIEGEKLRAVAEIQRSCQQEIERIRTDERRLASAETEKVRAAFLRREQLTTEDLIQLEELHAARIAEMEKHIDNLKQGSLAMEKRHKEQLTLAQQDAVAWKVRGEAAAKSEKTHALQAAEMKAQVEVMQAQVHEHEAKSAMYRTQLSKALEDYSVIRAESLAARNQAQMLGNDIYQWKKGAENAKLAQEKAVSRQAEIQQELKIAHTEIRRLKMEGENLRKEIEHADKLIYGVPQHRPDDRTYLTSTVSERPLAAHAEYGRTILDHINSSISSSGTSAFGIVGGASSSSSSTYGVYENHPYHQQYQHEAQDDGSTLKSRKNSNNLDVSALTEGTAAAARSRSSHIKLKAPATVTPKGKRSSSSVTTTPGSTFTRRSSGGAVPTSSKRNSSSGVSRSNATTPTTSATVATRPYTAVYKTVHRTPVVY